MRRQVQCSRAPVDPTAWFSAKESRDALEFVWLGQAGFIFKGGGFRVGIDPYLSNSLGKKYRDSLFTHVRMVEPPCEVELLRDLDCLFSTHGHSDHMDPETLGPIYQDNVHAPLLILPRAETEKAADRGVPRGSMVPLNAGETWSTKRKDGGVLKVTAVAAAHERLQVDAFGNHVYLGYCIDIDGIRIFHSGDCVPYDGLTELLTSLAIDVAFLPVNGRDAFRAQQGVPGNFTIDEALKIVRESEIPCLVPHHFGMFDFNTVEPEDIERHIPSDGLSVLVPELSVGYTVW